MKTVQRIALDSEWYLHLTFTPRFTHFVNLYSENVEKKLTRKVQYGQCENQTEFSHSDLLSKILWSQLWHDKTQGVSIFHDYFLSFHMWERRKSHSVEIKNYEKFLIWGFDQFWLILKIVYRIASSFRLTLNLGIVYYEI